MNNFSIGNLLRNQNHNNSPVDARAVGDIHNFATKTESDQYFLEQAFLARSFSDDPKAKSVVQSGVGAVIARKAELLSSSANVLPPRVKASYVKSGREVTDAERYFVIEHAERAAIFQAWQKNQDLSRSTLYCTRFPCSDCARAIAFSGISRLVVPNGFAGESRWIDAQRAALRILRDAGVKVRYLPRSDASD